MHKAVWFKGWKNSWTLRDISLTAWIFSFVAVILYKEMCQKTLLQMYFSYPRTLLPPCTYELQFSLIPLPIDGSYAMHFLNSMVNSQSVCVYCSGSRAQFRTMLSCSSHITVLSYKTSWWHGFSQGQTLSSISIYQIPCWCRELWFVFHYRSVLVDNTCSVQGTGSKSLFDSFFWASTRKVVVVRRLGSHFTDNRK